MIWLAGCETLTSKGSSAMTLGFDDTISHQHLYDIPSTDLKYAPCTEVNCITGIRSIAASRTPLRST